MIPKPLRRLLVTLPVLWVVVTVVFLLIHLVPGDPIVQMLGEGATATDVSALAPCVRSGCAVTGAVCDGT